MIDLTTDDVPVLEDYFMDANIEEIIKLSVDFDEINIQFHGNYPDFANEIYLNKVPSTFAKDELGFLSTLDG